MCSSLACSQAHVVHTSAEQHQLQLLHVNAPDSQHLVPQALTQQHCKPTQQAQALAALVMPCWYSCPTPACRPAESHVRVMRHSSHTDMHSPMHVQLAHASASVHVYMQATSAGKAVTLVSNKWQPLVKQEAYSTARHLVSQGRCLKRVTTTSVLNTNQPSPA
jgi:hypothetical protein